MRLIINGNEYTCRARVQADRRIDYVAVSPAPESADLTGKIETYDDAGNLVAVDLVEAYQRAYVVGVIVTLSSEQILADPEAVETFKRRAPLYDVAVDAVEGLTGSSNAGQATAAEQLRRALQMFAATLTDEQALEVPAVYPTWQPAMQYAVGEIISYGINSAGDPQLYKIVQAHTSQEEWTPDATPALYDAIGLDESGYPIWSPPSGAHDAYNTGDIVNYNGTLYISLIDGNVYSPEVYPAGWQVYTEE